MYFYPMANSTLHLGEFTGKEVVRAVNEYQLRRGRRCCYDRLDRCPWTINVFAAADKEFWLRTAGKKIIVIIPPFGMNRKTQGNDSLDPRLSTTGAQADIRAEREAGEEDGQAIPAIQPVQGREHVVYLSAAIVVLAFA